MSRLANFDKPIPEGTPLVPPDMFMPEPPRLGVSGSLVIPPPLPVAKGRGGKDKDKDDNKKKTKKKHTHKKMAAPVEDESEVMEVDNDDDDVLEEQQLGRKGDSVHGEDDDSSPSSDDERLSSMLSGYMASVTQATPPPPPPKKKVVRPDAPLSHAIIMRRMLNVSADEPLPDALTAWDGAISMSQLHDYQVAMTRLHANASTGSQSIQNAMRQLDTHVAPVGPMSDVYEKFHKPYCLTKDYANIPVHADILQGNYKIKD